MRPKCPATDILDQVILRFFVDPRDISGWLREIGIAMRASYEAL